MKRRWQYEEDIEGGFIIVEDGRTICISDEDYALNEEQTRRDGLLIAAAPELLQAAKMARKTIRANEGRSDWDRLVMAHNLLDEIITKAERRAK